MNHWLRVLIQALLAALVVTVAAEPPVSITHGDYVGVQAGDNVVATDKDAFYLNLDGTPRPDGYGTFDPVELGLALEGSPAKVVYRKTSTIRLTVSYYNPNGYPASGPSIASNILIVDLLGSASWSTPDISKSIVIPPYSTVTESFDLGVASSYVTKLLVSATFSGIGLTGPVEISDIVYVTYETPQDLMATPWVEVLEESVLACYGLNNVLNVLTQLSYHLHYNTNNIYEGSVDHYLGTLGDPNLMGRFRLSKYINDSSGPYKDVDCRDVSSYLKILLNCHGIPAICRTLWYRFGAVLKPNAFITNPLKGVGEAGFAETYWNFHNVVSIGIFNQVYDSCAAFKFLPTGILWYDVVLDYFEATYWQNEVASTYYGLVNGYIFDPLPGVTGDEVPQPNTFVPLSSHDAVVKYWPPARDMRTLPNGLL